MGGVGRRRQIMAAGPPPDFSGHLAAHFLLLQGVIPQGLLPHAYVRCLAPLGVFRLNGNFTR